MTARRTSYSRADLEARLGPVVVAAARRLVDAAPPLTTEQRERLRPLFAYGLRDAQAAQAHPDSPAA